jgi:hypothetical protein
MLYLSLASFDSLDTKPASLTYLSHRYNRNLKSGLLRPENLTSREIPTSYHALLAGFNSTNISASTTREMG